MSALLDQFSTGLRGLADLRWTDTHLSSRSGVVHRLGYFHLYCFLLPN
jgi:hypothetical protein